MVGGSRWCTQGAEGRHGVVHPGWAEVHRWSQAQDILVGVRDGKHRAPQVWKGDHRPWSQKLPQVQGTRVRARGPEARRVGRGSQVQDTQWV